MERNGWEKCASILFCIGMGALFVFLLFRYLFGVFLPFLIAWGVSLIVLRISKRLSARLGLPQKLCSSALLLLFLALAIILLFCSVNCLMRELRRMLSELIGSGGVPRVWESLIKSIDLFFARLGFFETHGEAYADFRAHVEALVLHFGQEALQSLSQTVPKLAGKIASSLPNVFLFVLITVIAGFYFCMEPGIVSRLVEGLPRGIGQRVARWKEELKSASWKYLRAYLLLLLLTVVELLIGFWILRVEYAFLLACLIALLDMLPVLGVGTVLIPWATAALLQKNFHLGFGMLILYFAIFILRQIMEPRLIGKSLGLHPLSALLAGYAGWKLFGFFGMAIGPIAALFLKTMLLPKARD